MDTMKQRDALLSTKFYDSIDHMFKKQQLPNAMKRLDVKPMWIPYVGWSLDIRQDMHDGQRILARGDLMFGYTSASPTSFAGRMFAYKFVKHAARIIHGESGGRDSRIGQWIRGTNLYWKVRNIF